jgi:hypothetical protein
MRGLSRFAVMTTLLLGAWIVGCSSPPEESAAPESAPPTQEAPPPPAAAPTISAPREEQAPPPLQQEAPPTVQQDASEAPQEAHEEAPPPPPEPEIVELEVPGGTILELELLTALDSGVNRAGDEIQARTVSPLYVEGKQVLAEGAYVEGRVLEAKASGRVKGRAQLAFTFDRLRTPTGTETIRTSYVEQEAESGKKKDAAIIGGATGVGAIVGGIIGGKKGAAIGASVGGAGGTGVVLSTKGQEIRLPTGSRIHVRLEQAITIQLN